jgi:hypothetical protein
VCSGAHAIALKRHSEPAHETMVAMVARVGRHLGVRRPVRVVISSRTHGPATLGWLRPLILLPPATAMGLTPQQLEAVLAHELAHIRRHDYAANILQMVVETLFFYHPAIWWASKRIRVERELCCDDLAVASCGDVLCYAQALTTLARLRVTMPSMAVGVTGGPLLHRIQRLLGEPTRESALSAWPAVLAMSLVLACGALNASWIRAHAQGDDASAEVSGLWEIRPALSSDAVQLRLCYADEFSRSEIPVSRLDGFSSEWLRQDGAIPFFTLRRDAGIFSFEGTIQRGVGVGTYRFSPAASFPVDLEKRHVGPPTFAQQAKWPGLGSWTHTLALYDIGFAFFDGPRMQEVVRPDLSRIVRRAQNRAQLEDLVRRHGFGMNGETVGGAASSSRGWC